MKLLWFTFLSVSFFRRSLEVINQHGDRGPGTGDRGTGNGEQGTRKWKMETKQRIENKVTDRARVLIRFYSHFSFSRSTRALSVPCSLFLIIVTVVLERIFIKTKTVFSAQSPAWWRVEFWFLSQPKRVRREFPTIEQYPDRKVLSL